MPQFIHNGVTDIVHVHKSSIPDVSKVFTLLAANSVAKN